MVHVSLKQKRSMSTASTVLSHHSNPNPNPNPNPNHNPRQAVV